MNIEWKQHGEKSITSFIQPGYDCGKRGVDCKHEHKGDHGIHNDEWVYAVWVPSLRAALSLTVFTDGPFYPGRIQGSALTMCTGFSVQDDDIRMGGELSYCPLIDAPCWIAWGTSVGAREFFTEYALPKFDQAPSFFDVMCAKFDTIYASIHVDRLPKRCAHCDGRGLIGGEP